MHLAFTFWIKVMVPCIKCSKKLKTEKKMFLELHSSRKDPCVFKFCRSFYFFGCNEFQRDGSNNDEDVWPSICVIWKLKQKSDDDVESKNYTKFTFKSSKYNVSRVTKAVYIRKILFFFLLNLMVGVLFIYFVWNLSFCIIFYCFSDQQMILCLRNDDFYY